MKITAKLIFALCLLIAGIVAHGQEDTTKYIKYPTTYGVQYPRIWGTKVFRVPSDTLALNPCPGAIAAKGTNPYWWDGSKWNLLSVGTVGAVNNTNSGTGYRLLTVSTQAIKTLFSGYGFNIDSTTNTNGITFTIDSAKWATHTALLDSVAGRVKYTDTSGMLAPYLRTNIANATYVHYTDSTVKYVTPHQMGDSLTSTQSRIGLQTVLNNNNNLTRSDTINAADAGLLIYNQTSGGGQILINNNSLTLNANNLNISGAFAQATAPFYTMNNLIVDQGGMQIRDISPQVHLHNIQVIGDNSTSALNFLASTFPVSNDTFVSLNYLQTFIPNTSGWTHTSPRVFLTIGTDTVDVGTVAGDSAKLNVSGDVKILGNIILGAAKRLTRNSTGNTNAGFTINQPSWFDIQNSGVFTVRTNKIGTLFMPANSNDSAAYQLHSKADINYLEHELLLPGITAGAITDSILTSNRTTKATKYINFNRFQVAGNYFVRSGDSTSYVWFPNQSSTPSAPASGVKEYGANGRLGVINSLGKNYEISTANVTAGVLRIDSLKDASGSLNNSQSLNSWYNINNFTPTQPFTANNQTLYSVVINPNFTNSGVFTGMSGIPLLVSRNTTTLPYLSQSESTVARLVNKDATRTALLLESFGTGVWSELVLSGAGGTGASPSHAVVNQLLGQITTHGYSDSGYGGNTVPLIRGVATQNYNDSSQGQMTDFYVRPNNTTASLVSAMRFEQNTNVGVGSNTATTNFQVIQRTAGIGVITTTSTGITVNGSNTNFLNTFHAGQTITANGETRTIATITNDSLLTTDAWTNANTKVAYTLVGGTRFSILGDGNVGIGTTTPLGATATRRAVVLRDATNDALYRIEASGSTIGEWVGTSSAVAIGSRSATDVQFFVNGTTKATLSNSTGNLTLANNLIVPHIIGSTSIPTIAAGTGAGTSPTITVGSGSTDLGGYLNITTGTGPSTSATIVTITYNVAYATAPHCIMLTPANAAAAALSGTTSVFVNQASIGTTTFTITSGSAALAASTAYQFYYHIIQ